VTRGAPTEPELRKLRELGYVSEPAKDNEVLGGAFDDDKNKSVTASDDYFLGQGGKRQLEPDWRSRFEQFRYDCRLLPRERPRDMFFRFWGDNPFELAALDKLSSFSADVDSASYTLARKYLAEGNLPEKAQIRTEEFVNYFKGDIAPPSEGVFRIATELAPSLFGDSSDTWMLRVAIRGRDVSKQERQPLALTFVIDVSGSMREESRLELVKHALRQLANQLDARDSIALVKFSTNAELVLPMTSAGQRTLIESAIQPLQPDGSTNTEAGLRMGYELASRSLAQNTTNRVVLLTDGVANVGIVDPNALVAMVESQRKAGIYLNTVGVGMDNHNDNLLEQLADKGDGLCNYVDDEKEVRRALVDNFTGAFEPIARDVKIQVEFDPAQVERYRLLGYENRAIADADFRNDKVDAGEINAGHQVVALYELVRRGANSGGSDAPLATLRLRYKQPFKAGVAGGNSDEATEIAQPVQARDAAGSFVATSPGYRRSVLVAQFAEFLRRSIHARYDSLDRLIDEAKKLAAELRDPEFDEFVAMVSRSRELVLRELNVRRPPIDRCFDELRHRAYLLQQIDELERRFASQSRIDELDRNARDLDRQLDELRNKLESLQGQVDDETLARIQAENIELQRKLIELLERTRASKVK
jgi:Ca-activated chloride channel family protein